MRKLKLLLTAIFVFLLVDFSFAQIGEVIIAPDSLCIQKNIEDSQVICIVPRGTTLTVLSSDNGWHNVVCDYNGAQIKGWIYEGQLVYNGASDDKENTSEKIVLTAEQQEYLKAYTNAYVTESSNMNIYLYFAHDASVYRNSYNMKLTSGVKNGVKFTDKLTNVCCSFVADLLHQALGAPLLGETVDGKTYQSTEIRGTGFSNPNTKGRDVFVDVGDDYLQVGDVLSFSNYSIHSGLYLGYNPETGYHEVAQTYGANVAITNLEGTNKMGPKITIDQLNTTTRWAVASRLKKGVLPEVWEFPEYINWPSKYVAGKSNVEKE